MFFYSIAVILRKILQIYYVTNVVPHIVLFIYMLLEILTFSIKKSYCKSILSHFISFVKLTSFYTTNKALACIILINCILRTVSMRITVIFLLTCVCLIFENLSTSIAMMMFKASVVITMKNIMSYTVRKA